MNKNNKDIYFSCINPVTSLFFSSRLVCWEKCGFFPRIVSLDISYFNGTNQILNQISRLDERRSLVAAAPPSGDANIDHKPEVFMKSF